MENSEHMLYAPDSLEESVRTYIGGLLSLSYKPYSITAWSFLLCGFFTLTIGVLVSDIMADTAFVLLEMGGGFLCLISAFVIMYVSSIRNEALIGDFFYTMGTVQRKEIHRHNDQYSSTYYVYIDDVKYPLLYQPQFESISVGCTCYIVSFRRRTHAVWA